MTSDELTKGVLPRVQWGPVLAGVLCAVAAQIVLGLFGIAFGFAPAPSGRGLAILAGIWGILTPIVASFIGAFIAVRVAGDRLESGAFLHGVLVWCIALIAGAIGSGAMTAGVAASGNIGAGTLLERDAAAGRIQIQQGGEDAAKGAAAGTGAAGVAALLGLGGALFGAAAGWSMVTGESLGESLGRRRASRRRELERPGQGVAYTERGAAMTRPPDVVERRPEEPPGRHH